MVARSKDEAPRVLVVRPGALGDLVLAEPAVRRLREAGACVSLAVSGRLVTFARACLGADEVLDFDAPPFGRLFGGEPPAELSRFDAALVFLAGCPADVAVRLASSGIGRVELAEPSPREGSGVHAADHLAQAVKRLGLSPALEAEAVPRVEVAPAGLEDVPRPVLAVHPGAGSAAKCWPAQRFAAVAARWREARGGGVALVEGEADASTAAAFLESFRPDAHLAHRPLAELASALAGADAYLGNDSGVTHLAAAAGARVVALFGPTDARLWAPRGERVTVLCADSGRLADLDVEAVTAAAMQGTAA